MNKVKVGIIGTGHTVGICKSHLEAYKANNRVEITALYDIVPGRAEEWAKKNSLEGIKVCNSLEEIFGMVDAVSLCTPNSTHVDLAIKALEAGKHVISEKPISTSYKEAKRAVDCANKHPKLVAMTVFNYREIPVIKYIKKIIDDGKIGRVFTCRQELGGTRIANPTDVMLEWRMQEKYSGTGALADFGVHMIDLADYLLANTQGRICEVNAMTNTFIKERTIIGEDKKGPVTNDDSAVFSAKMEGGTLLSFVSSRLGVPREMMEICGEGGMIVFNGKNDQIELYLKDKNGSYAAGKHMEVIDVPEELKCITKHQGVINEFIDAILDGKPVIRNFERGLYIQNILDMLKKSADEGRTIEVK